MAENNFTVTVNGIEYPISSSMRATRAIFHRFGSYTGFYERFLRRFLPKKKDPADGENIAGDPTADTDGIPPVDKYDETFASDFIFLLALFINQPILKHNYENPKERKDLITEEYLEIFMNWNETVPIYIKLLGVLDAGSKRTVEGGDIEKNKGKNA